MNLPDIFSGSGDLDFTPTMEAPSSSYFPLRNQTGSSGAPGFEPAQAVQIAGSTVNNFLKSLDEMEVEFHELMRGSEDTSYWRYMEQNY